ncbi:MAG: ligand-gated channel protein, partial [Myxococcota bacterium]
PEVSHNANLELTANAEQTRAGGWRGSVNGFVRDTDQLIVLLGTDRFFSYENVFGARSAGVEGALGWTSPGEYFSIDGNVTYLDFRNSSSEGTFGDFEGDRIPNRPYLFANGRARAQLRAVAADRDELSLEWNTRYVHGFFRGWESVGLTEFKQTIPAQLLHSLALTYLVRGPGVAMSFTGELQNLTDAAAFDFFGVQRPGRAFYFKTALEF